MSDAVVSPPSQPKIRERERTAILQSLRAGVVPRVGIRHIAVGRKAEVEAILRDLAVLEDGGAAMRFVVGRFGSGKSFFLNLVSAVAIEKNFLVARADITPDRRLHGSGGQPRALFSELMRSLSSKARPDGGALQSLAERWITDASQRLSADAPPEEVEKVIVEGLKPLHDLVGGFDLATVVARYFRAYRAGDEATQQCAIRWLRAEYDTRTEARRDLGTRAIIEDATFYEYLKLLARFARMAGYAGMVVCIDELVVLSHRLGSSKARASNYETILRMLNDSLQGSSERLMLLFGATDEALEDRKRGLFSYEALATRLAPNDFAKNGIQDLTAPVIKLQNLSREDLFVLLMRIRDVFALGDPAKHLMPDEGLRQYMVHAERTLGESYFRTPRDTVVRFVGLMSLIEQDPNRNWQSLLGRSDQVPVAPSMSAEAGPPVADEEDDLVSFKL